MKMQESTITHEEAVHIIETTISTVKQRVSENGFVLLLWGWIVLSANLLSYYFINSEYPQAIGYTWMVLCTLGGVVSGVYHGRKQKKEAVKTRLDQFFSYIWAGVGIGAALFYTYLLVEGPQILLAPFILCMAGVATFISGRVLKFAPLVWGAMTFWVFTILCFYFKSDLQFILSAAAMVTGYLVPGYMLRSKHKKEHNV